MKCENVFANHSPHFRGTFFSSPRNKNSASVSFSALQLPECSITGWGYATYLCHTVLNNFANILPF